MSFGLNLIKFVNFEDARYSGKLMAWFGKLRNNSSYINTNKKKVPAAHFAFISRG